MQKIKIIMNGAAGRMGRALAQGLGARENMSLVAAVDTKASDVDYGLLCGLGELGFKQELDLAAAVRREQPDVVVDFTSPAAVMNNVRTCLQLHTPVVVGTTGFSQADYKQVAKWCADFATPAFIAANFALGAVLLMRFAQQAVKYMPHVEVIERHHDQKLDAPSGTAVTTLEMLAAARTPLAQGNTQEFERMPGSRGGELDGMRVHSVRLPGYVATQEVVFGAEGQVLCLRHDALSREAYVPGVALAVEKIVQVKDGVLIQGLESILD